jgi:hypothetical protein
MQSNFKKIIEFHKAFGIKSLEYIIIYIISLKYI